jgi:hypothetical protein
MTQVLTWALLGTAKVDRMEVCPVVALRPEMAAMADRPSLSALTDAQLELALQVPEAYLAMSHAQLRQEMVARAQNERQEREARGAAWGIPPSLPYGAGARGQR